MLFILIFIIFYLFFLLDFNIFSNLNFHDFGSLQLSLLCIMGELAMAVTFGVSDR